MRRIIGFLRDRRGGAMLYTGAIGLMTLASVGAMMTNYAWQEAQYEELRGALRAGVSASGRLLANAGDASVQQQIKERVANFVRGLMSGLLVDDDDITVEHDATTQETWVTVGGTARYKFSNLWGGGGTQGVASLPETTVGVALDFSQYEIAVAADISESMGLRLGTGTTTRISALRTALDAATDVLEDQIASTPGSMAAAIVPFSHLVNVADTSGSGATDGKLRYARMLTGASVATSSVSAAAKGTDHHYYDAYASYGRGRVDMTPLISKKLPITEATPNWDLRQSESVDVSGIMPGATSTWLVNGSDFWNGCVMARWGAYWDAAARPTSWDGSNLDSNASLYPAASAPASWYTGGSALASNPLHLSDVPPDHADPNTRFTAYSFPDSSIGGTADGRIEALLKETLTPNSVTGGSLTTLITFYNIEPLDRMRGFNDWTRANRAGVTVDGDAFCPTNPILPLTDDPATLRAQSAALTQVPRFGDSRATYIHLGVVWGVRALSPLWQEVWATADDQGAARPLKPCAENESTGCADNVKKIILLLTDGESTTGGVMPGRAAFGWPNGTGVQNVQNPQLNPSRARNDSLCGGSSTDMLPTGTGATAWKAAAGDKNSTDFNGRFSGLDSNGRFNSTTATQLAEDWGDIVARPTTLDTPANRNLWETAFSFMTPWQLFRGDTFTALGGTCEMSDLLAGKQPSGCNYAGPDFGLDGRPTQRPACRPNIPFGPYGNMDDFMRVGGHEVVAGASAFKSDASWAVDQVSATMTTHARTVLNDWLLDACTFANDRGVSIVGVYLGSRESWTVNHINRLEACVDAAGGRAGVQDIHITPTPAALETAFREIFAIRTNLRFLN